MSFSLSRMAIGLEPSVTLQINATVSQLKKHGVPVISLGAGEPDFDTPRHICQAAIQAIEYGQTRYTAVSGISPLREAICSHIKNQKRLCYTPDEIIVGTGAKQVLFEALQALLNPGDEVLLPAPCWVSYHDMIRMAGGEPILIETTPDNGFLPTISQIASAVTNRTKAIIINTPNNPTGAVWPCALLSDVMHLAQRHDFYVISDEIYENLVYDDARHISPAALSEDAFRRTIVVSGFSKSYAMTGWRVGYAAGPQSIIAAMTSLQSHQSGSINTIAQYAALAALEGDQTCVQQFKSTFAHRRTLLLDALEAEGLQPAIIPMGAFYALLDIRPFADCDIAFSKALLQSAHVAVVPGTAFCAPGFIRLSYAVHDQQITQAVARIGIFLRSLK